MYMDYSSNATFQAPALHRAVIDSTQGCDETVPSETQQLLQTYLEDPGTVDSVYSSLLHRALVNDSSEDVVAKCIVLLKQYIERYTPSRHVMVSLSELCITVNEKGPQKPGTKAAAAYLLRKLHTLLGSEGSSLALRAREQPTQMPMRHSTADELLFATSQLDIEAQPTDAAHSVALILQRSSTQPPVPAGQLTTALQGYLHGNTAVEPGGGGSLSSMDIISSILEGSTEQVAVQVQDIVQATMTQQASSWPAQGGQALGPEIGPRLYSPPLYSNQEPLVLDEAEVSGVVGLVCAGAVQEGGQAHPRSWGQEEGLWRSAMGQPSLGQMCASILVKLLLDMWMHAPPPASSALASRMLASSLASPRPDIRCRALDLLYNLSMHSALLGDLSTPEAVRQLEALEHWLRGLLYSTVDHLMRAREECEEVWRSALGVLLQLLTHCGHISASLAADVPPPVAMAFLDRCLHFSWSEELYCHLVELAAFSLLPEATTWSGPGSEASSVQEWEVTAGRASRLEQQLAECGGMRHLLAHYCCCPTATSRGHLLRVLLHAVVPAGAPAAHMAPVASLLLAPTATEALQTALRLPVPGLAAHLQSCLTRAAAAAAASGPDASEDGSTDIDSSLLLRVLSSLEAASLSSSGCVEAAAVEAALMKLPAGTTDPLVAWQLLRNMRPPALAHPTARKVAVLRLYRIIDTSIAQHQVGSLPQLAAVGLLPQPPSASAVLQGAAVPQSLLADLLTAGPHGAAAAVLLVQRLLAALRHRVLTAARGRDAAASTLRWHLAAACVATWQTLVQWLQQAPGGVPRALLRKVAREALRLPSALVLPRGALAPPAPPPPDSEGEVPLAGVLVAGRSVLSEKSLQLLGPLLVPLLQLLAEGRPPHLQLDRGCYIRLHRPPVPGVQALPPALWAPWSDTDSDNRLALVLLLLGHWQLQPAELAAAAAQQVVRSWLEDGDPRVRYVGGRCLQLQLLATQPEQYWSSLRVLVLQAQRLVQYQLVDNPLLQMSALQEMKLV